jgi:hypothetical protein
MATYIGYYRINEDFQRENGANSRQAGELVTNQAFRQKVIDLRDKLPASIKLVGSYGTASTAERHPNIWIAETDDPAELQFVNNWYAGFLEFDWIPATVLGATASDTAAAMDANQARR